MRGNHWIPKSYSLRTLLILITLFMLWGGYHTNRGWRIRASLAVLRNHHLSVAIEPTRKPHDIASRIRYAYLTLIHTLWGDAIVPQVHVASKLDPAVVKALNDLPDLQRLSLQPRHYSSWEVQEGEYTGWPGPKDRLAPGALEIVLNRHEITSLDLVAFELTDEECEVITKEHSIETVQLIGANLSAHGLDQILRLPRLRYLRLHHVQVDASRLSNTPASLTLTTVDLSNVGLSPESGQYLARCPKLQTLWIVDSQLNDDFVSTLKNHPSLEDLTLAGPITDQSATSLAQMPRLRFLNLPRGDISSSKRAGLQQANPRLTIR